MLNGKILEIGTGRGFRRLEDESPAGKFPDVPVLPETLLLMELNAKGSVIDLTELSQVALGDIGATIQIYRRASDENSLDSERLERIEDCISVLGANVCLEALSCLTVSRKMNKPAILKAWAHARQIAECCKLLATGASGDLNPNHAHLVGLLHELGYLPSILDWGGPLAYQEDPTSAGLFLAQQWCLPQCVVEYFSEPRGSIGTGVWSGLVQKAHEMTRVSSCGRPSQSRAELS